jgi:hypothetical protein
MKLTKRKRKVLVFLSFGIFFFLVFAVILYSLGYRMGQNWHIQKTGGIFIQSNESGASVLINGTLAKTTSLFSRQAFVRNLTPGVFSVEVSKDTFYPWRKSLLVLPETVDARDGLLVPINPVVRFIATSSPLYEQPRYSLKNHTLYERTDLKRSPIAFSVKRFWGLPRHGTLLIQGEDEKWYLNKEQRDLAHIFESASEEPNIIPILTSLLTSKEHIIFDDGENQVVYWDEHTIGSYWIGKRKDFPQWQKGRGVHILTMPGRIRNVAIYPKHPDYLLMELGSAIWALEMDQVGGQNMTPVYQGSEPHILGRANNGISISDDKKIMEVELP